MIKLNLVFSIQRLPCNFKCLASLSCDCSVVSKLKLIQSFKKSFQILCNVSFTSMPKYGKLNNCSFFHGEILLRFNPDFYLNPQKWPFSSAPFEDPGSTSQLAKSYVLPFLFLTTKRATPLHRPPCGC